MFDNASCKVHGGLGSFHFHNLVIELGGETGGDLLLNEFEMRYPTLQLYFPEDKEIETLMNSGVDICYQTCPNA